MDHWLVCVFVCTVLGLPKASHMLGQGQACLGLRTGLRKLKTVGDVLPVQERFGRWMRTGWSEVPPSAGGVLGTLAYSYWVALPSPLGSLVEGARQV